MKIEVITNAINNLKDRVFKITPKQPIVLEMDTQESVKKHTLYLLEIQQIINNYGRNFVSSKTKKEQQKRLKDKLESANLQFGYGVDYQFARAIINTIVERTTYEEKIVDKQQKQELLNILSSMDFYKNIKIVSNDGYSIQQYMDLAKVQIENDKSFVIKRQNDICIISR